jgi:hypothetical protein
MGQFLDSAAFASGTGGGTQTPTDGKKSTVVTTGGGNLPVSTVVASSVMSPFSGGGTRVCYECFHRLSNVLFDIDSNTYLICPI